MIGLVLCLLAAPDVTIETPLGTVARPGVPALVVSSQRVDATVGGWPYRLDGATMVFVERTPCELRVDGAERVAWSAAPERQRLVGVIGPEPGLGAGVVPVRIRPAALRAEHWRCLDLFDRIVVSAPADVPPGCLAALRTWLRAGGEVVWGGDATALADADAGLGTLHRAGDIGAALRAAGPARGLRIPRPPATAPEIYDLVGAPAGGGAPLRSARWIVLAAGLALLAHLALAQRGGRSPRYALGGVVLLAAAGAAIGVTRPEADYRPVARGRIEVSFFAGGVERCRTYEVFGQAGPGAGVPAVDGFPVVYRTGVAPWWETPNRAETLEPGIIRIYLRDEVIRGAPRLPPQPGRMAAVLRTRQPDWGRWAAGGSTDPNPPSTEPGAAPVLARLEVVLQD